MEMNVQKIINSSYSINCKDINALYNKEPKWTIKNALRELNQKRIKNCKLTTQKKKLCIISNDQYKYKCPHCNEKVNRLTSAHVGKPVSKIIDEIIEEYPNEYNVCFLDDIVKNKHNNITIVICCDKCNSLLDDSK